MREEISRYQRKLKLSTNLMDIYPAINAQSHEEFLLELLKKLCEDREEKRRIRNLNNAGFQVIKSLERYDFSVIKKTRSGYRLSNSYLQGVCSGYATHTCKNIDFMTIAFSFHLYANKY